MFMPSGLSLLLKGLLQTVMTHKVFLVGGWHSAALLTSVQKGAGQCGIVQSTRGTWIFNGYCS